MTLCNTLFHLTRILSEQLKHGWGMCQVTLTVMSVTIPEECPWEMLDVQLSGGRVHELSNKYSGVHC